MHAGEWTGTLYREPSRLHDARHEVGLCREVHVDVACGCSIVSHAVTPRKAAAATGLGLLSSVESKSTRALEER